MTTETRPVPLPGSEVTCVSDRTKELLRVRAGSGVGTVRGVAFLWYGYDAEAHYVHGTMALADEGVRWARGWNTKAARALEASLALLR